MTCAERKGGEDARCSFVYFISFSKTTYLIKFKWNMESFWLVVINTRSYAALRAADLDWIVRAGYSLGGYI